MRNESGSLDHIAIMKKEWGLIPKILSGEKKIESRWYLNKYEPWDKVKTGDKIFFKNSGEPITVKASVSKVVQLSDLNPAKVKNILLEYAKDDGLGSPQEIGEFYERFKNKRYCIFIYLDNVESVRPFLIDKSGFGMMSAWITIKDIKTITKGKDD